LRADRRRIAWVALAALLVLLALLAWWLLRPAADGPGTAAPSAPVVVSADRIDPANEGRLVAASGTLEVTTPARDPALGVEAPALVLLRHVEMRQWHEECTGDTCIYTLQWSEQPVEAASFREPAGHANPPFPFADARFEAGGVRLGAFSVTAAFAADDAPTVAWPVNGGSIPPNLAATLRERGGILYAGAGPQGDAAGELRISYRVVAAGPRRLVGVQRGSQLVPPPHD
jgi:hypothetical protein